MNQSKLGVHVADPKRWKTRASELQLVLVLLLIGWKGGASFLSQSCSIVDAKPTASRHSNENRSISRYVMRKTIILWHKIISTCSLYLDGIVIQANSFWKGYLQLSKIYNSLLVCHTCQWWEQWKRGRWTELEKVRPTLSGRTGSFTFLISLVNCESVIYYQVHPQGL